MTEQELRLCIFKCTEGKDFIAAQEYQRQLRLLLEEKEMVQKVDTAAWSYITALALMLQLAREAYLYVLRNGTKKEKAKAKAIGQSLATARKTGSIPWGQGCIKRLGELKNQVEERWASKER